ncbi:HNH endonuclease [Streptomyces sp. NPDC014894]|uniref:HNH endonuclease n=1 Tax=unclassified Streptomyces TaxID=2593676 RepID=UPI003700C33F
MNKKCTSALAALSLALLPLLPAAPTAAASPVEVLQLEDAISVLVEAEEFRAGYTEAAFPHWNEGKKAADGCSTREEVLLAEAVEEPDVTAGCRLSRGKWVSYYDNQTVTKQSSIAVDHVVPLAEAYGSGGSAWSAERREAYANDQGSPATLAAVTVRAQEEKAGRDVKEWLPPESSAICRYIGDWVGTKLRWGLTADKEEMEVLKLFADNSCETTVVLVNRVP